MCRMRIASSQPTAAGSVSRKASSSDQSLTGSHLLALLVVQITVRDQVRPDLTSRVEQGLVQRVPSGVVPDGQCLQGSPLKDGGLEDPTLMVGEVVLDGSTD